MSTSIQIALFSLAMSLQHQHLHHIDVLRIFQLLSSKPTEFLQLSTLQETVPLIIHVDSTVPVKPESPYMEMLVLSTTAQKSEEVEELCEL